MNRKDYDIIIFTLFRTDHAYSSVSLSWAKELAKNNRVFYVNHPYSVKDAWKELSNPLLKKRLPAMLSNQVSYERIKEIPENFIAVQPPLTLPINWLQPGQVYDFFQKWNNKAVLKAIKKVIKDFKIKKYIYINCYDPYYAGALPKELGADFSIYQSIDDISQDPYSAKHGRRLEEEAIAQSDFAMVTSTQLREILKQHNHEIHVVHNAVDISIFEKTLQVSYDRPDEMKEIRTPVIGFTGNLDYLRIDYPLLKKTAEAHPDKTLVLVGPINSSEFYEVGLDKVPNVISTGAKNIRELPAYLQHMDVCLIPFLKNTLTASIYPLKINEYLAAGKPVVSTSFSRDIRGFSEAIYLAQDHEEFLKLINKAIAENEEAKIRERHQLALQNTWTARVEQFWKIVEASLDEKVIKTSMQNETRF